MPIQDDFENVEAGEPRVLVPQEGIYSAEYLAHSLRPFTWGLKLIVEWKVFTSLNRNEPVRLCRFYNWEKDRAGRPKIGDGHSYRKDWIAANGGKLPLDRRRLPIAVFQDKVILVAVSTVTKDTQRPLSPACYWSKIGWIFRPLGHGEIIDRLPLQLPNF